MSLKTSFLSGLLCFSFAVYINAQDSSSTAKNGWKISTLSSLTLSFNSYSDNWAGSEFSAFSWGLQFNGTADRAHTPWLFNKNTLKLAFGQTATQKEDKKGEKDWESLKKSSDLIDLESVAQFTLKTFIDPFISVRAITQFADMRVNEKFYFNPLELTESFGAIKDLVKNDFVNWSLRLGGAARQMYERNYILRDSLGISEWTNDGGIELVTDFKAVTKDKRLSYITQLKVYEAIFSSSEDKVEGTPIEDYWRYPDVTWENTLNVNLAKYIMFTFYTQLLYDKEIDRDVRFKQITGLGLSYSFSN